jgi:hypothetical protein
MTQSIVFILCETEETAKKYKAILDHPLYVLINNICRWGNFNNIRILQSFPVPDLSYEQIVSGEEAIIYSYFGITEEEVNYIKTML